MAQKVTGVSLIWMPMNWFWSATFAIHPLLGCPSKFDREQSWYDSSKQELKKNCPISEAGERLLMQYLDSLTSMGVISKSQLLSPSNSIKFDFFQKKHSPFLSSQFTLHLVQSFPLYSTHPLVQGKHIDLQRKYLSAHLEHTPLMYSSQYPSFLQHWKQLFKKYLSPHCKHLVLSQIEQERQAASLPAVHYPSELKTKPLAQSSQRPFLQERQLILSITHYPSLIWY